MDNNQVIKRVGMLSGPLAFAALTLFHSHTSPSELGEGITRWIGVHSLQLVLSVWLAYCVWWILDGIRGAAAQTARAALPIFLVFFSATDAVAGLATGWLTLTANSQSAADQAATLRAVDSLFNDNWLTGSFSVAGSVGATAWAVDRHRGSGRPPHRRGRPAHCGTDGDLPRVRQPPTALGNHRPARALRCRVPVGSPAPAVQNRHPTAGT